MSEKVKVGISKCLLGEKVRYDGGHKLDRYLRDTLGQFVEWVGVCPEVECGLPIPREAVRLVGDARSPRLLTQKSGIDHTERMLNWGEKKIKELSTEGICGYVFKTKSPSSGMRDIKIYNDKGMPYARGPGIFARIVLAAFPYLPVEDDGRLQDPSLRENFIERIFVYKRWQDYCRTDQSLKGLVSFHTQHKLLLMAHSPRLLSELGAIVARAKQYKRAELLETYGTKLLSGLKLIATVKKNTNILFHMAGYLKKLLSKEEKDELITLISNYHRGLLPLIAPIILIQHYVQKYGVDYLSQQYYLHPHPLELMLRNHV